MKLSRHQNIFDLENLEPRILLSGEGLLDPTAPDGSDSPLTTFDSLSAASPPAEEVVLSQDESRQNLANQEPIEYNPAEQIGDLFAGIDTTEIDAAECLETPSGESADQQDSTADEALIAQGFEQMARVVTLMESANQLLSTSLPFVENSSLGELFGLHETIDSRLKISVFDYFNDGVDPPSMHDAKLKIAQNDQDFTSYDVSLQSLKGTYSAVNGEIRYDLQAKVTRSGFVCLDTAALDQAGISLSREPIAAYTATLELDFGFGLDPSVSGTGQDGFFLDLRQLDLDLTITADHLDGTVTLDDALGSVDVADGQLTLSVDVNVQVAEELTADGRISGDQLTALTAENFDELFNVTTSGSLTATLPLELFNEEGGDPSAQPVLLVQLSETDFDQLHSFQDFLVAFTGQLKNSYTATILNLLKVKSSAPEEFGDPSTDEVDGSAVYPVDAEEDVNLAGLQSAEQQPQTEATVTTSEQQVPGGSAAEQGAPTPAGNASGESVETIPPGEVVQSQADEAAGGENISEALWKLWQQLQSEEQGDQPAPQWALLLGLPLLTNLCLSRTQEQERRESLLGEPDAAGESDPDTLSQVGAGGPGGRSIHEAEEPVSSEQGPFAPQEFTPDDRSDLVSHEDQVFDGLDPPATADHDAADQFNLSANYLTVNSSTVPDDGLAVAPELTASQLNSLLQQALQNWTVLPLTSEQLQRLDSITVATADLPAGILGEADGYAILVDVNAAGYGWFVDGTPDDDFEFALTTDNHLSAVAGSDAYGDIDLLTVLNHEVGHVLGYDHDSGLAVMGDLLGAGQRVVVENSSLVDSFLVAGAPIAAATILPPILDLSGLSNIGQTITIQVNSDGTLNISGTASGEDGTNIAGITTITGNIGATITLIAPNLDNIWMLTGINAGTLSFGTTTISFSATQNLTGGNAKDTFILNDLGFVSGDIDDGVGTLEVQLAGFVTLAGDFDFSRSSTSVNLSDGTTGISVNLLGITVTSGLVFFGNHNGPYILSDGGTANDFSDDTYDADAVGFHASITSFALAIVSDGTNVWYAAKGVIDNATLKNISGFTAASNGTLKLNTASGGNVIDFASTPVGTIDFSGADGEQLHASGSVALNAFGFVVAQGTFALAKSSGVAIADGTLTFTADVLTLTATLNG
ncbi:MAG: LEPR-XLL domain-containing protein, partial [Desulfuromonadales bacterium]|nr:LEPR-XLL domain-containing protein [Desulfuromonadales bacterium]